MKKKRTKIKVQAIWIAKANLADSTTKCIENKIGQYWRKEAKREKEKNWQTQKQIQGLSQSWIFEKMFCCELKPAI